MFTLNDLPFGLFAALTALLIPLSLYEYSVLKKRQPGNPMNKIIASAPVLFITLFFRRYATEVIKSDLLIQVANIVFIIVMVAYAIIIPIGVSMAYKRGYGNTETLQKLKPLFKLLPFCILFLIVIIIVSKLDL